jgi:biopolymer transport protein ExbD
MNEYIINQIFTDTYPPEAALWCNKNRAYIEEIEPVTRKETEVEQISGYEYDEDGNPIREPEFEEKTVEVTVRRFQIVGIPEPTEEELAAQALAQAKAERAEAVAAITVEVDGMTFDGDETAQERMARTVTAATATGASMDDTTVWVLHDNTVATPTIRQLATALRMAGEAQTALWTKPYEA